MAERPILFSGPMVSALLAGTKTQTRRAVKLKAWHTVEERDNGQHWPWMYDGERNADYWLPCPYGQTGDRLWVRETHMDLGACFLYRADAAAETERTLVAPGQPWRPAIHMPRAASRITLEVTGVRVERLQDISEADAEAEGKRRCYESTGDPQYLHEYGAYRHAARIVREQAAPAPTDLALALAAAQQSYRQPGEPEAGWCLIDRRHVETLCKAAQAAPAPAAVPARVYLVATGETHNGLETYTRHDDAPPPLCDAELLFTSAQPAPAQAEHAPTVRAPSDAEIAAIWKGWPHQAITGAPKAISFARAVLAAAGITATTAKG